MPDIKLDFSRVTYSNVLELIAPIVPGGILGVGTLVLNPSLAAKVLSSPFLGYRSRLIAALFISYTAGLLLNLLVSYTSYFIGYLFGYLGASKLFASPTPWENLIWRRVARRFLGPEFAPSTDELYFENLHKQKLKEANDIQDAGERERQVKSAEAYFAPKRDAASDWFWWYQILGKYFAMSRVESAPWQYFLSMVHSASWAVIFLMVFNQAHTAMFATIHLQFLSRWEIGLPILKKGCMFTGYCYLLLITITDEELRYYHPARQVVIHRVELPF